MPVYENVPTIQMYPYPELNKRKIFEGINFDSILDVGAGHGGVFDLDYWEKNNTSRKEACDIFWIRPMPNGWTTKTGVDVMELDKHYKENEFDFVQCCETLEHVANPKLALQQLKRVARKAVFLSSADEMHHIGEEQLAIEKENPNQAYRGQPSVEDMVELGFTVMVEAEEKRQLFAWLIKS